MTCTSIPASPAPCSTREIRDPLLQRDHRERSEAPITSWVIWLALANSVGTG